MFQGLSVDAKASELRELMRQADWLPCAFQARCGNLGQFKLVPGLTMLALCPQGGARMK